MATKKLPHLGHLNVISHENQGCQIFLDPNTPKWEKYTKGPQTIPNGQKLYQNALKYSK
jgi:hypothetical protein